MVPFTQSWSKAVAAVRAAAPMTTHPGLLQGGHCVRYSRVDSRHALSRRNWVSCGWIYTLNPTPALLLWGQSHCLFSSSSPALCLRTREAQDTPLLVSWCQLRDIPSRRKFRNHIPHSSYSVFMDFAGEKVS